MQWHTLSSERVAGARVHKKGNSMWQGCRHSRAAVETSYKLSSFKSAGGIESERKYQELTLIYYIQ